MTEEQQLQYPLFETIKYCDGRFFLIPYHYQRIRHSVQTFFQVDCLFLSRLEEKLRIIQLQGLHKVKVFYNQDDFVIHTEPYFKRRITKLKIIHANEVCYELKYTNRSQLTDLKFGDEEVLVCKNDQLTDTTFSNIALWNGSEWHTPTRSLLRGVKRSFLLQSGILKEKPIGLFHLKQYQKVALINAMLDLDDIVIPINQIII